MWLVVLPAILFLRRRPEDIGLLPDGDTDESVATGATTGGFHGHGRAAKGSGDFTVRDALRTKTLWMLVAVSAISSTGTGAIHLHLAPYLTDSGITANRAALVVSVSALIGGFGSLFWGFLGERVPAHRGIMLIYGTTAFAVLILAGFSTIWAAFAFAFLFGFASRGGFVMLSIATADYYGRSNLGTIQGIVVPLQTAGLGIGQIAAPVIRSATGSYQAAFLILAGLYVVASLIGALIRPPKNRANIALATAD
jgi:MFS family permease